MGSDVPKEERKGNTNQGASDEEGAQYDKDSAARGGNKPQFFST